MKICSSDLNSSIIIQSRGDTKDSLGGRITVWSTFASPWAKIKPTSGYESRQAGKVQASITHKVTIRYLFGVLPKMRILFGTRIFDIHAVLNTEERNVSMVLMCEEGTGA